MNRKDLHLDRPVDRCIYARINDNASIKGEEFPKSEFKFWIKDLKSWYFKYIWRW